MKKIIFYSNNYTVALYVYNLKLRSTMIPCTKLLNSEQWRRLVEKKKKILIIINQVKTSDIRKKSWNL